MYLGSWKIDDFLTFPANTHDPSTGAATDADAVPTYRVYEDETATPILTGSMALLDTANTTGFYSERIQLTAANGFEAGKSYTVYVSATVGTVVGTISHTFQVLAEPALHADWQNGGRLDLILDAIKAVTDLLPDGGALSTIDGNIDQLLLDVADVDADLVAHNTNLTTHDGNLAAVNTSLDEAKGATFDTATDSLEAIRDRGDVAWVTAAFKGSGVVSWTYTLTNAVGGAPIPDALVEVSTDANKGNVIASGYTDNFGQVTFNLDPGTYYLFRTKAGWDFTDPDIETVT